MSATAAMGDGGRYGMDVHDALKEVENSLRDFIVLVLQREYGDEWIEKCGISEERIKRWEERKAAEAKRQQSGAVEERLLYYADFYDLRTILHKNWSRSPEFVEALGKQKTIEVFLTELEKLRDPHAHQRELLPHQKHLIIGLSGEIRNRLIRYRSKMETGEDYFPRLESVRDDLGNVWVPPGYDDYGTMIVSEALLRPGDTVTWVVSATDPMGDPLSYRASILGGSGRDTEWQESNVLSFTMTEADVGRMCDVNIYIRSPREYHAMGGYDDIRTFRYEVLPPTP
jgi:hypothetical protein